MFFKNTLKNNNEPFLEPIFRELRFGIARRELNRISNSNLTIFDYGCGPEVKFYTYILDNNIKFKKYYGFDPLLKKDILDKKLLITSDWKKIEKQKFDLVTMFAVLEHLPFPYFDYEQITNKLKKNGCLLLTTPTKLAKPVLEFLSYKIGIVSRREIKEHQHYFDLEEIEKLFISYGLYVEVKKTFEIGMNNYVMLKKK